MEVHVQACQKCSSQSLRNILVRESGQPQTVYLQCATCGEFVAQYRLTEYYDHGQGFESWLQSFGSGARESGRDFLGEFERVQADALEGFQSAVDQLQQDPEDELPGQ